jgi:hypothetical protein
MLKLTWRNWSSAEDGTASGGFVCSEIPVSSSSLSESEKMSRRNYF